MRDVADAVGALRVDGLQVAPVGLDRLPVGEDRVLVTADAQVDVRRHVHEVAGARHAVAQEVGARLAVARPGRRLLEVNPVVMRAGVIGNERQRAGQLRDDRRRPRLRLAVGLPPVVRVQVEDRLGGEHRDFPVLRQAPGQRFHRPGVAFLVEVAAGRMADRQRGDQALLRGRRLGGVGPRLLQRRAHALAGSGVHVAVDVGSERPGERPPACRAVGIDARGGIERARGLGRIEAVGEEHSLVDVLLRQRLAGVGGQVVATEVGEQRGGARWQRRGDGERCDGEGDGEGTKWEAQEDEHGGWRTCGRTSVLDLTL